VFSGVTKNCKKCVGGRDSAPDPAGGAYSAHPDSISELMARGRGREKRRGKEGRVRGRRKDNEKGKGLEGRKRGRMWPELRSAGPVSCGVVLLYSS